MTTAIFIQKELRTARSGIYMMMLSNGYFYIGASKDLKQRIKDHKNLFVRGRKTSMKSFELIKDFNGTVSFVSFYLLEEVIAPHRKYGLPPEILARERFHKAQHEKNELLLNRIRRIA